jgi:hypothetical protein
MNARLFLAAAAVALGAAISLPRASAGTVYLQNGEEIDGEVTGVDAEQVTLKYKNGTMRIALREVQDIEFRPGESIWEDAVKKALENSRRREREEAQRRLLAKYSDQGTKPPQPQSEPPPQPQTRFVPPPIVPPEITVRGFTGLFESREWGFTIHFPAAWEAREAERGFFTFRDPRDAARAVWSFDVTAFDELEADYATIVDRARKMLDGLPSYEVRTRGKHLTIGRCEGERTTGMFQRDGRVVRHDQVIVKTRRGVLVFHFFSPGAPSGESGVPDVESVIGAMEVR